MLAHRSDDGRLHWQPAAFLSRVQWRLLREWRQRRRMFGPPLRPNLWRVEPISREFGFNRGQPIDRYYIEQFLAREAEAIRGHVLEIGHNIYTRKFGGARVEHSDVLYRVPGLSTATIVADLADAPQIPSATFDCI